ncbi:STM4011 family radical SAM protein [Paenibacillus sp. FSL L8-0663]|uniref:STM4011 family radical SAM protein n=1 Tax=Paenibacillus sp. FSL L8-0663 TaxID=2921606 RepID=UPI0030FAC86C
MRATLYYRGSLTSCNYACPYCPFSKNVDSRETLNKDRVQLERFADWVREQGVLGHRLSIFFNPYGEALIHSWYRKTMIEFSHMAHVEKVAVQTNLSTKLDWTKELNAETAALWATCHPGETKEQVFISQAMKLYELGISYSVGTVGLRQAFPAIRSLRSQLPRDVYLWVNAYKDRPHYYTDAEVTELTAIDPYFQWNLKDYSSQGRACRAGEDVFYVQGDGRVKHCYQDRRVLGHLYRDGLEGLSGKRPCRMRECGCYIGYIHMEEQPFREMYGSSLLERVPQVQVSPVPSFSRQAVHRDNESI